MGYKNTTAQLMSVPPYAAAAIVTIAIGFIADRTGQRGICAIIVAPLGVAGFAILLTDAPPGAKYAATFLAAIGIYPCIPNTIAWVANNTEGVYKRGFTLGLAMGWANLQGCGKEGCRSTETRILIELQSSPTCTEGWTRLVSYLVMPWCFFIWRYPFLGARYFITLCSGGKTD